MILSWLSFIITPIMVLLIINAERIITLLLTKKWIESSGFLIVLCVSGIFIPINNTILNIFNVLAKPLITTYVFLFKITFSALCIMLLFNYGPLFIANVIVVENIIVLFILGFICNKIINLSTLEIFKSIGPSIIFNSISALIIIFIFKLQFLNAINNFVFVLSTSTLFLIFVYVFNLLFKTTEILIVNKTINKYLSKCF